MQLGGKGANLAEMCRIGLTVPPGFTITTDSCAAFHSKGATHACTSAFLRVYRLFTV
jgi:phosphoenolpyruvate synthase/pyruvate phosphate dikinase